MIEDLNARVVRLLLAAAAVIIFLLGFLVCADIFGRAIFNSPVKGTPEIVSMSIVIICFLLAGYSVQSNSMISTDVFSGMFGTRGIAFAQLLSAIFGLLFFGIIVWGSYEPLLHAINTGEYEGEGALRVPVWPTRLIVVVRLRAGCYQLRVVRAQRDPRFAQRTACRIRRRAAAGLRTHMLGNFEMFTIVLVLLALVFAGVHIAIALGITAALGLYLMTDQFETVRTFVANTAYEALRDYVFAVIPLFMLMGDFLAKCGAARDLYALGNRASKWLPGRLAVATIVANALFGFVTGVSIAAAAAFSRIAYPEMRRYGYRRDFALGSVAGSACLGMLIPPSVLMIVWCVLTELSIGKLFLAGVIPGLLAAAGMVALRRGRREAQA